ncbi:MAG: lysophospholipid acyltransferase family protein [Dysgonamonadaceae bacterium]|jgi:putative hemolysin|nr:lysophospholipid acyltransferase family protein [Dysgonamonadaceae bacterium]
MKEKMIGLKELQALSSVFKKPYGIFLAKCVIKIAGIDKANRVYDSAKFKTGTDIEDAMIDGLGITRKVHNIDILKQFEGKPFITVSNHPYGHVDGIMLVGEVCKIRRDFKVMVNWMLSMVDIMQDHFIGVNPFSSETVKKSSLSGVKECLQHLRENHPLGFFPAGAVSKNIGKNKIEDRKWQEGVIKLIQKAQVPVIPVYISGQNSWFFNFLDKIDWRVRTIRLCHELNTKKGKTINMVLGTPIFPEEQAQYRETQLLGEFLKKKTYELSATLVPE